MAEYIDREALIDWLTTPTGFKTNCEDCTAIDCLDCIVGEVIQNFPADKVAPVVHGRWITKENYHHGHYIETSCFCSECNTLGSLQWKGCPVCLARMDGE